MPTFLVMILAASVVLGQSTAERLGYSPQDRVLMVHADDLGMSHTVNAASMEAFRHGLVTSASVMVPCPWFLEIANFAKEHPEYDIGLHLTLTSEWRKYRWGPVASRDKVPGLIDAEGYLWRDVRSVAQHATAAEVETELRAQIDKALATGWRPTHLDTHMGTLYARLDYWEVYAKLGREYNLPVMLMRPTPEFVAEASKDGYPITPTMLEKKDQEGYVLLDHLVTGVPGRSIAERKASYKKLLTDLKPGVTMLIVHLGLNDDELKNITNNWEARWSDYRNFTDPEMRDLFRELSLKQTTWRAMSKLVRYKGITK
ncbi:MAG: polysaccharide deacetylase family protein [Bryobacteraceae bacterium]|nr:polysaccharide deacetylase family protein [Bryobacteraceae bacterium]